MVKENADKIKRNMDPVIIVSTVTAALVIGGLVWAAKKAGPKVVKDIANNV